MTLTMSTSIRLALISTATSVAADVVLQRMSERKYELKRTLRTGSFAFASSFPQNAYFSYIGRVCNGPVQKTMVNQFMFAPVNIAAGIAWNLALQNRAGDIKDTIKTNIIPGLTEGAAYWIPLNMLVFSMVPQNHHFVTFKLVGIPAKFIFVARTTK
ncbi:Mpv17 / PMP22 family protein [Acanthocystis turfacea Chlorella virus Canal-1]|nr:Mpv17 / PMP22 family protein [Acanthocystis turfacea Chlorella virus Canal-1]